MKKLQRSRGRISIWEGFRHEALPLLARGAGNHGRSRLGFGVLADLGAARVSGSNVCPTANLLGFRLSAGLCLPACFPACSGICYSRTANRIDPEDCSPVSFVSRNGHSG